MSSKVSRPAAPIIQIKRAELSERNSNMHVTSRIGRGAARG
jgi:hypothetical protein